MEKVENWLASLELQNTPSFAECVMNLGCFFPLLNEFEQTEQDSIWHAEGNVAIHTDLVLKAVYELLAAEASHITGKKRQALILSALLHDIAKPLTTRKKEIQGQLRVVAPLHEEIGASYLATKLIELPLEHSVIMVIMGLVGFHQVPKRLVIKNQEFSDYFKLSLNADLELLYWLELADMRGRVCNDLAVQLDLLEQYRMFAQDYELWGVTNPTTTYLARIQVKPTKSEQTLLDGYAIKQLADGDIKLVEEAIAKNYTTCQQYSHCYIMCGISGSGKSTWIANNLVDFEVISLDDIRAEINGKRSCQKSRGQVLQLAKQRFKKALAEKRNLVWDATSTRKDFREPLIELAINYGALVTLVVFQLSAKSLKQYNHNRTFSVSDDVQQNQLKKFEWPWQSQTHRQLVIGEAGQLLYHFGRF